MKPARLLIPLAEHFLELGEVREGRVDLAALEAPEWQFLCVHLVFFFCVQHNQTQRGERERASEGETETETEREGGGRKMPSTCM